MNGKLKCLTGSGLIDHYALGPVRYVVRKSARRFVARWKADMLHLTVPEGASCEEVGRALDEMMPRLLARKPEERLYFIGQRMEFETCTVRITGCAGYGDRCTLHRLSPHDFEIRVDNGVDLAAAESVQAVSRMMKSLARFLAPTVLLPRAAVVAAGLGVKPREWRLSSGRRTLGRCDARGVISLSSVLVFAPSDLRDYVVMHELAHLSEMNHSARFHLICDRYCGGRARELEARLKAFRFPLV